MILHMTNYQKNIIGLSTVMINKKILNHIKFPDLKTQEDFAVWLNLLKKGIKLSHIPTALSSWRKTKIHFPQIIYRKF